MVQKRETACHKKTARMKWNKEVNKVVMEYFYRSKSLGEEGNLLEDTDKESLENGEIEDGEIESTEQRVCDQAREIRKNGRLYCNLNWK